MFYFLSIVGAIILIVIYSYFSDKQTQTFQESERSLSQKV